MQYVYTTSAGNFAYQRVAHDELLCMSINSIPTADANIILHLKRVPNTTLENVFNGISTRIAEGANDFDYKYAIAQTDTLQNEVLDTQFLNLTSTADPNITTTTADFSYPYDHYLYSYELAGNSFAGNMRLADNTMRVNSLCKLNLDKESSYVYIWLPNNTLNTTISACSAGINLILSGLSCLSYDIVYAKMPNYWSAFDEQPHPTAGNDYTYKYGYIDCRFTNVDEIRNADLPERVPITINSDIKYWDSEHYEASGVFNNTYKPISVYNSNCTFEINENSNSTYFDMISASNVRINPNTTTFNNTAYVPDFWAKGRIHSAVNSNLSGYLRVYGDDQTSGYLSSCYIVADAYEDPEYGMDSFMSQNTIIKNCNVSSRMEIYNSGNDITDSVFNATFFDHDYAHPFVQNIQCTLTRVTANASSVDCNECVINGLTASATTSISVQHNNNVACSVVSNLSAVCLAFDTPFSPAFCLALQNCYVSAGQLYNYHKAFQNRDPYGVMYYYAGEEDKVLTLRNTEFNIEHVRSLKAANTNYSATWLRAEDSNITCPASSLYGISAKRCYINGTYYEEKIPS